jgi:sRNA-binding carbon storage regulator CsrA
VKLGIKAPENVTILRKEIRDAAEHNREAARRVTASTIQDLVARLR